MVEKTMLTKEELSWVEGGVQRNMSIDAMEALLTKGKVSSEKIVLMMKYADTLISGKSTPEEEALFKEQVETFKVNPKKLSWGERRKVKRWLRELEKLRDMIKKLIKKFGEQKRALYTTDNEAAEKERGAVIEVIMAATSVLEITYPQSNEMVTREGLEKRSIDDMGGIN